jgi:hypothetical protein
MYFGQTWHVNNFIAIILSSNFIVRLTMKKRLFLTVSTILLLWGSSFAKEVSLIKLVNLIITSSELSTVSSDSYNYSRQLMADNKSVFMELRLAHWDERFKNNIDQVLIIKIKSKLVNLDISWNILKYREGTIVVMSNNGSEIRANEAIELRYINDWFAILKAID